MVSCPICGANVQSTLINAHLDSGCQNHIETQTPARSLSFEKSGNTITYNNFGSSQTSASEKGVSSFFQKSQPSKPKDASAQKEQKPSPITVQNGLKRSAEDVLQSNGTEPDAKQNPLASQAPPAKRAKPNALQSAAPLAERMRPKTLDEVYGQSLVGPTGVLRGMVESRQIPSMVLWGGPGTGKTTIARLIASSAGARFVEINSTSSGVAECKKLFADARSELSLTGRRTIIFCDEIHRFSKSQQDVFLGPVESGVVTLIGATTENPSFKVVSALLSRCRTFTLSPLTEDDIVAILERALDTALCPPVNDSASDSAPAPNVDTPIASTDTQNPDTSQSRRPPLLDSAFLHYLARFASGDARTALNLLELAFSLCTSRGLSLTLAELKQSLTHTLVYDRQGDAHYDAISAFHKAVRGSDPDAALFYLARMLTGGEDPLFIARRMVVIASEDIGLADNNMLGLATATYTAVEKVGLPEARINLGHCATALALSPKSTRSYRALAAAMKAVADPAVAALPIPLHLRNAPTRLMKELNYGKGYKYNPDYVNGQVQQDYLPTELQGVQFLSDRDLGTEVDEDLEDDM